MQVVLAILAAIFGLSQLSDAFVAPALSPALPRSSKLQMSVDVVKNPQGLEKVILKTGSSSAEIYTLGACITSYEVDGHDYLFVRPDAKLDGSKPISGGVPFCWPQFGPSDVLQQHGFARNLDWEVVEKGESHVTMKLTNSEATMAMWAHPFELHYTVSLKADSLDTEFKVMNTGDSAFDFTGALHTYFRVGDINKMAVKSPAFTAAHYLDKNDMVVKTWDTSEVTISGPTDSVFYGVSGEVVLDDAASSKKLAIKNEKGWVDTIIWNPYGETGMGYANFVCVESGLVEKPASVAAGASWTGIVKLVPQA